MSRSALSVPLAVALALSLALSAPVAAAGPTVSVAQETLTSTAPTSISTRSREPSVATHPSNPNIIAVTYPQGDTHPSVVIRISHDGGKTFRTATGDPRGGGNHPVIAWGPGPIAGSARLYYGAMTTYGGSCCYFGVSYSDNEGRSWSAPFVAHTTTPWFGGFPYLATDNNKASPNFGTVYAAYNWPKDPNKGPGLRLLASSNFGRTFNQIEVPVARPPAGYGDTWRIDYRIATAADGSAYVAFFQRDVKVWTKTNPFSYGSLSNVGRIGFSVAHFTYDRSTGRFTLGPSILAVKMARTSWNIGAGSGTAGLTDPMWNFGLDVDPTTGKVYLATGVDGGIRVYSSANGGATWSSIGLPAPPRYGGKSQRIFHPNIVIGKGFMMVTLHTIAGTSVGNSYSVSSDGGRTWSVPGPVSASRWQTGNIGSVYLGVGLRERAALTADRTHVFWAYGDGRRAVGHHGLSAVYGALIAVTGSVPPPAPTASPTPGPTPTAPPTPNPTPTAPPTPNPT